MASVAVACEDIFGGDGDREKVTTAIASPDDCIIGDATSLTGQLPAYVDPQGGVPASPQPSRKRRKLDTGCSDSDDDTLAQLRAPAVSDESSNTCAEDLDAETLVMAGANDEGACSQDCALLG